MVMALGDLLLPLLLATVLLAVLAIAGTTLAGAVFRPFLAIRYLLTRPINLLGMLGVMLGTWALIVVVSVFSGFLSVIAEHVHSACADLNITRLPSDANWPLLAAALRDDPNVDGAAPRLLHFGLLHRPGTRPAPPPLLGRSALQGGDQPFLFVLGVDQELEQGVTGFRDWLRSTEIDPALRVADPDRPLQERDGRPAILLGLERMRAEGWKPGDVLVFTSGRNRRDGERRQSFEPLHAEFTIAGAFKTKHGGFDGNNVFVALPVLQRLLFDDGPAAVHEVAVKVKDEAQLIPTANRLERAVERAVGFGHSTRLHRVETWREKNGSFLASVEHQRGLLKIVLIVIMVVAAFLMYATLSMMVTEKTGDIGILTAMGGTPIGVMLVFLACGLMITLFGVLLGVLTGCLSAIYLEEFRQLVLWLSSGAVDLFPLKVYNLDRVPHSLDPWWIAQVAAMALVTGLIVAGLPALRAARHDPLVSLRGS